MRTLYIECNMGAAGDMLTAALSELVSDHENVVDKLNSLNIPNVEYKKDYKISAGIRGAHMHVYVKGVEEASVDVAGDDNKSSEYSHTSISDIEEIVAGLNASERVKNDILGIYRIIAEAESYVHGKEVSEIHFHEVGNMDAIADVAAVCLLMEMLNVDKVISSPIHVGSGNVRCAHGILPVPAPATAHILQGIPMYGGRIQGELCTPTGAAILKYFANDFGEMPLMTTAKIGIGVGNKEFEAANIIRAFLGESQEEKSTIVELNCNVDDATGEEIGFATKLLMEEGALDVFTVPIQMKKSRPGHMIVVMAKEEDSDRITKILLKHTSTIGVRKKVCERTVMNREVKNVSTKYGDIRVKTAWLEDIQKSKIEYEDIARIAKETGKSFYEISKELNQ